MRRLVTLTSALVVTALSLFVGGCAGQPSHANAPDSSDPAWTPPGEMMMTLKSGPEAPAQAQANALAAPTPNRSEIRTHQIHAALN